MCTCKSIGHSTNRILTTCIIYKCNLPTLCLLRVGGIIHYTSLWAPVAVNNSVRSQKPYHFNHSQEPSSDSKRIGGICTEGVYNYSFASYDYIHCWCQRHIHLRRRWLWWFSTLCCGLGHRLDGENVSCLNDATIDACCITCHHCPLFRQDFEKESVGPYTQCTRITFCRRSALFFLAARLTGGTKASATGLWATLLEVGSNCVEISTLSEDGGCAVPVVTSLMPSV